jgi:hypothetical protein
MENKEIKAKLNANWAYFEIENDVITIKPVQDAAGSLSEYARNLKHGASIKQMKNKAWEKAVRENNGEQSS